MNGSSRERAGHRLLGSASLVAAALLLLLAQPWRGPVLFVFSSNQGIDLGDLPVAGMVTVAWILVRDLRSVAGATGFAQPLVTTSGGHRRWAALAAGAAMATVGASELSDAGGAQGRVTEALVAVVVLACAGWFALAMGPSAKGFIAALLCGLLLDALATPSGTVFGPMFVAAHLAITTRRRSARSTMAVAGLLLAATSAASLADVAGLDEVMADGEGGPARTLALGLVLVAWSAVAATARSATSRRS